MDKTTPPIEGNDEPTLYHPFTDSRVLRYIQQLRERRPLPPVGSNLRPVSEQQCTVIMKWLDKEVDLNENAQGVFHSNRTGLIAIQRHAREKGLANFPSHLHLLYTGEVDAFNTFLRAIENEAERGSWLSLIGPYPWYGAAFQQVKVWPLTQECLTEYSRFYRRSRVEKEEKRAAIAAEGGVLYEFTYGCSYGPLAGHGGTSLWRVDDNQLRFVEEFVHWIS